jgi:hypothetical protein
VAGLAAEARLAELRTLTLVMAGLGPAIHEDRRPGAIQAFLLVVIASSRATKQSSFLKAGLLRFARNDGYHLSHAAATGALPCA